MLGRVMMLESGHRRLAVLLMLLLFLTPVFAQPSTPPGAVADEAVSEWQASTMPALNGLSALSTVELCQLVPTLLVSPPPPAGTSVNLDDRLELEADAPDQRVFTYSAVGPSGQLNVVQVTLQETAESWQVLQVGFRQPPPSGLRAWVQTPAAAWSFGILSVAVLVLLLRPGGWLPGLLARGLRVIARHRGAYLVTLGLLTGGFVLGIVTGNGLPQECHAAILETVESAVSTVGATEAYASGNISRAATVTFYQNFMVVSASTLFSLALLFGVPAYLFGLFSFYVQAIPFGLLAPGPLELLIVAVLLLLELTAYFTVIAGGGFLLLTLLRNGLTALPEAIGKLLLMLPLAGLLLLVAAWYEAFVLIGLS